MFAKQSFSNVPAKYCSIAVSFSESFLVLCCLEKRVCKQYYVLSLPIRTLPDFYSCKHKSKEFEVEKGIACAHNMFSSLCIFGSC